jgi:methyl-accepting chemotaxis protein
MAGPSLTDVLLVLISVGVMINIALMGWIAKELFDLRERIDKVYVYLFGINNGGLETEHEDLRHLVNDLQESHEEVEQSFRELKRYLQTLAREIDDVPPPDEELDD